MGVGGGVPFLPLAGFTAVARGYSWVSMPGVAMKVVYEAANLIDAHLVRHALEAADIPVYLRGESLVGGMGELGESGAEVGGGMGELPMFGVVAVCVPETAWSQARAIVDELALDEPLADAADDEAAGPDALLA